MINLDPDHKKKIITNPNLDHKNTVGMTDGQIRNLAALHNTTRQRVGADGLRRLKAHANVSDILDFYGAYRLINVLQRFCNGDVAIAGIAAGRKQK